MLDFLKSAKSPQHRLAWVVAIIADAIQLFGFPVFAEGAVSPADTALDVVVAIVLSRLLGWHWAFLPTFLAELVPGIDLIPTWTAAVFLVTRQRTHPQEPEILPPDPVGRH